MWLLKPGTGGCPGPLYSEICSFSHNFTRNGRNNFVMITGSRAAAGGASFRRVACGFRANCIVSLWGESCAAQSKTCSCHWGFGRPGASSSAALASFMEEMLRTGCSPVSTPCRRTSLPEALTFLFVSFSSLLALWYRT